VARLDRDILEGMKRKLLLFTLGSAAVTESLAAASQRRESEAYDLLSRIERSHARAERLYGLAENVLARCEADPA
jgi:hypothetical protein